MIIHRLLFALAVLAACTFAPLLTWAADQPLTFVWQYTADEQALISGFRLYRDGNVVEVEHIAPELRTVTVPRQADKTAHSYHLTAYNADEESNPSNSAIDVWRAAKLKVVGEFIVQPAQ